jgi:hypothetical protein
MYWLCGYLQNQVLLTSVPTGLIFYQSRVVGHFYVCWYPGIPSFPWVLQAVLGYQQFNKFNQLVARSIIVTHMKSIFVPSLTLKVYGPMRPHIIPPKGWWQQVLLATYHIDYLTTVTLFDMWLDGMLCTLPMYCTAKSLFEVYWAWVL